MSRYLYQGSNNRSVIGTNQPVCSLRVGTREKSLFFVLFCPENISAHLFETASQGRNPSIHFHHNNKLMTPSFISHLSFLFLNPLEHFRESLCFVITSLNLYDLSVNDTVGLNLQPASVFIAFDIRSIKQ